MGYGLTKNTRDCINSNDNKERKKDLVLCPHSVSHQDNIENAGNTNDYRSQIKG